MKAVLHLLLAAQLSLRLHDALALFAAHRPAIEARLGKDQAIDLGMRLVTDIGELGSAPAPGYTQRAWNDTLRTVFTTDAQAVQEALAQRQPELPMANGLHEGFVRSAADGLWEPVAVYIPPEHAAHPPLAVVLHGRPQSETELLGQPYLRELADRTGTILVAPWGRGIYDFHGVAAQDLDGLVPVVQRLYASDPHELYLVGYSMGGFSVFSAGTLRPWSAIMCIAGALLNSEVPAVRFAWRDTPLYVVNGSADEEIPPAYGAQTAAYLASLGIPVSFYQMPGGHHALRTLVPVLEAAWNDMHRGIVRAQSVPERSASGSFLPAAPSLHDSSLKP